MMIDAPIQNIEEDSFKPIEIKHVVLMLAILSVGLISALALIALEYLRTRRKFKEIQKRKNKVTKFTKGNVIDVEILKMSSYSAFAYKSAKLTPELLKFTK